MIIEPPSSDEEIVIVTETVHTEVDVSDTDAEVVYVTQIAYTDATETPRDVNQDSDSSIVNASQTIQTTDTSDST